MFFGSYFITNVNADRNINFSKSNTPTKKHTIATSAGNRTAQSIETSKLRHLLARTLLRIRCNTSSSSPTKAAPSPTATSPTLNPTTSVPTIYGTSATGWRIFAAKENTGKGWHLDIDLIEFYPSLNCTGPIIEPVGDAIDSGNAGSSYIPENGFSSWGTWGGRHDDDGNFWLGMIFEQAIAVRCLFINLAVDNALSEMRVQAFVNDKWMDVWVEDDVATGGVRVNFDESTLPPTGTPTGSPTAARCIQNKKSYKSNVFKTSSVNDEEYPESNGKWFNEFNAQSKSGNYRKLSSSSYSKKSAARDLFWDIFENRDFSKDAPLFTTDGTTLTLSRFKYLVLPIWWSDEPENCPATNQDPSSIAPIMNKNIEYYHQMSWNKFDLSYEILPQQKFTVSSENPGFGETEDAAFDLLETLGYEQGDGSFDGVILTYSLAQNGPFSGGGGWGNVNGPFTWMSYSIDFSVTRHEIGHNFGHPHHRSMLGYRKDTSCECDYYDGFDMMSGGNGYDISHFSVASKWFFNWVPDSAIKMMQPEGSTAECPDCVSSGTFTILAFDKDDSPPQANEIMGIHIPVLGEGGTMYSYWLSYRSGVDGFAAIGLSVHLTWIGTGGMFGGYYDSLNYDAHGDTETTFDSFVLPNTCYIIEPPLKLLYIDPAAAEEIWPKVCVDSMDKGNDITVSVSFLDTANIQQNSPDQELVCSANGASMTSQSITSGSPYLLHITGTGHEGVVSVDISSSDDSKPVAYIYDRYPFAPLVLGAPLGYGSFGSFGSASRSNLKRSRKLESTSVTTKINEAWIVIPELPVTVNEISCVVSTCGVNQYMSNNVCVQCPDNMRSDVGSTSQSDCEPCPPGSELAHPQASVCPVTDFFDNSIDSALGWRIWAADYHTTRDWVLDVDLIKFYSSSDCAGSDIDPTGTPVDSGNAGSGWGAVNAFTNGDAWGGRKDDDDYFWLGMMFDTEKTVRCLFIDLNDGNELKEMRVQAYVNNLWTNVWIEKDVAVGGVNVQFS